MNKITIIGNSCRDVELQTSNDKQYARINIAVSRKLDKEKTDFFNCVAFGKSAEVLAKYVKKGAKIAVTGRIEFNEDKDGKRHHSVIVEEFDILSWGGEEKPTTKPVANAADLPF